MRTTQPRPTPTQTQNYMTEQSKTQKKVISQCEETQKSFWTLPQPENSPLGAQKVKNDSKIKSKSELKE